MIRFLQQDSRVIKFIFAAVIGVAVVFMVITLVPGIFDNVGASSAAGTFATVHSPGLLGRLTESSQITSQKVNDLAQRQLHSQHLPPMFLPYVLPRAGQFLVEQAILKSEADRMGLQVSDEDLRRELQTGQFAPYLFPGGNFIGKDKYIDFIQTNFNISLGDFEAEVKKEMELNRLQALVTGGVTVSDNAVRLAYLQQGTKVKFDYAILSGDDLRKTINPSEADLQAFFKQNASRYAQAIPETRKLEYVAFDASSLPGGKPQITDADLQAYYNAHLSEYQVKEQARVRHILIAVPAGSDAKTDAAAKAKAQDLLKQIKAGADFGALAKANSDDPGSKVAGGELGFLDRGKTVPEFDKAAFTLAPGQTSDLVKTQFGYHILQVEEKTTAHTKPLAEVKAQILPVLEQQKAGAAEQSFAQALAAEAQKSGLDKAATAHNLRVVTTDFLPKEGIVPGLADGSGLLTQAFTTAKGAAPASVSTGDGFAVYQVVDIQAAHAPEFASYRQHILDDDRDQQVPQLLNTQLAKLADRAKVLNDLHKAAAEMNLSVKTSDLVGKDAQVPDLGAMTGPAAVAFTLPIDGISSALNLGQKGAVLSVLQKQEPTTEDIAKNFDKTREGLLGTEREEIFRIYAGNLTEAYTKKGAVRYSKKQPDPNAAPFGS